PAYFECDERDRRSRLSLQRSIVEKFKKCALNELNIVAGSHSESNAEIDTEVINITEDNAEIESFTQNERNTREKLLEVWAQSKIKKENLKRTMCHRKVENSLNEDQYACLNTILKKQADLIPIIREDTNLLGTIYSYLKIEYLIRPLPSVYLLERFMCTKVPETFDDFEKFSKDMAQLINWQADVLFTVKKSKQ
ncbi:17740_t:CDS:2, partial [Rhizophagus irregularis]